MAKKKRRSSKQAKLNREYAELLRNAKMIYNDLQLSLKLGEDTPSMERILREAGTRSGLKKPTKKSIKALKGLQTEAGILNKAMWSVWNKPEAREIAKEMFEEKRANEDELKKRKRELKKISNEWERLRDKKTFEELSGEEKKQFELLESVLEDYATPEEISKIQRLIDQASKVINEIDSSKVKSSRDEMIEMYARSIVDALQEVLSSGSDKDIKDAAKVCEEVTRDYGVLSYQEFYNSGAEIKTTIISAIYEALY